jgi:peptidoglycan/xylan/chitin deacetylase (PgdA/CDA1 family)
VGARDRIARLLKGSGVVDAALRLRARARVPYLTIITYHHVADPGPDYPFDPEVADVTPPQFERHLDMLKRHFNVIGIDDLCGSLDGERLPSNPALITFDDGYRSCHDVALPALKARGLRAVFFIPTWFVDERRLFWWERISWLINQGRRSGMTRLEVEYPERISFDLTQAGASDALASLVKDTHGLDLPRMLAELTRAVGATWSDEIERKLTNELLMSWDHIRALAAAGMDIESHTRKHRVLQTLDDAELDDELSGARRDLERALGRSPRTIAYPVGRSIARDPNIRSAIARAGYRVGFTNATGANWLGKGRGRVDVLDLSRLAVDRDLTDTLFASQLAFPQLAYRL